MKLFFLFLGLATGQVIAETKLDADEKEHQKPKISSKERKNRDELSKLIQILNGNFAGEDESAFVKYFGQPPHETERLPEKSHYVKNIQDNQGQSIPHVRLHLVKNPDVLEAFVKNLRSLDRHSSTSDTSSESDSDDSDLRRGGDGGFIRRSVAFREQALESNENHEVIDIDLPPSIEEQVTPFRPLMEVVTYNTPAHDSKEIHGEDSKKDAGRFKIKSKFIEIKAKDDWKNENVKEKAKGQEKDKVPIWNEQKQETNDKHRHKHELKVGNAFVKNNNNRDMKSKWDNQDVAKNKESMKLRKTVNRNRDTKQAKTQRDKWGTGEESWSTKQVQMSLENWKRKTKGNIDDDNWNKKEKSKFDDDKPIKHKRDFSDNDWSKKTKDNLNDNDWNKKRKDRFDDDGYVSSKKKKDKYGDNTDNFDNWDKKDKKQDKWDEPPKKKKKNVDRFVKEEVDNDWDKVGRDWGKQKVVWNDSQKTSRSSWQQKKKSHDSYEKSSFVAKNPEYHNKERGGSFHGRTPIPFIGRQGIYDDKK